MPKETCVKCGGVIKGDVVDSINYMPTCSNACKDSVDADVRQTVSVPTIVDYERFLHRKNRRKQTPQAVWEMSEVA